MFFLCNIGTPGNGLPPIRSSYNFIIYYVFGEFGVLGVLDISSILDVLDISGVLGVLDISGVLGIWGYFWCVRYFGCIDCIMFTCRIYYIGYTSFIWAKICIFFKKYPKINPANPFSGYFNIFFHLFTQKILFLVFSHAEYCAHWVF